MTGVEIIQEIDVGGKAELAVEKIEEMHIKNGMLNYRRVPLLGQEYKVTDE